MADWLAWVTVFLVCVFGITHGQADSSIDCLGKPKRTAEVDFFKLRVELNKKKLSAKEVFKKISNVADNQLFRPIFDGYTVNDLAGLNVYQDHQCMQNLLHRRKRECLRIESLANQLLGQIAGANLLNYCYVINGIGAKWCLENIVKEVKRKNKESVAKLYHEIKRYKENKKGRIGQMSDDDVIKFIMNEKMNSEERWSLKWSCLEFINQIETFNSRRIPYDDLKPGESLKHLAEMRTRASLRALLPDSNEWLDYYELCKAMHQPDIKDYIKPDGGGPMKTTAEC